MNAIAINTMHIMQTTGRKLGPLAAAAAALIAGAVAFAFVFFVSVVLRLAFMPQGATHFAAVLRVIAQAMDLPA